MASIRLLRMYLRPPAGGAFFFLAFRATQEVAPGRMRLVSTVLEVASSAGVRGLRAFRISVRGSSPSPPPRRSGFAGSRILLLLAAGLPPRRDSQVGPGPPALAPPPWRRRGRVPVAEHALQPGAGRGSSCRPAALVGPGSDVGAGRGLSGHLGSKPSRFSYGETGAPGRVTELMAASVASAFPLFMSGFLSDTCHLLGHFP